MKAQEQSLMTPEEAVCWLWRQPDRARLVAESYLDSSVAEAVRRFHVSTEWNCTRRLLDASRGRALDLGAGRGIATYALAMDGWDVTALEPDSSKVVGSGAIREVAADSGIRATVIQGRGERLDLDDGCFDLVYCRQVLHHVEDLPQVCREIQRVLKPGAIFLAAREHVIDHPADLSGFLAEHPLHALCGGEGARLLTEYLHAMREAGLGIERVLGPLQSPINTYPMNVGAWRRACSALLQPWMGYRMARFVADERRPWGSWLMKGLASAASRRDRTPGRFYTFLARKVCPSRK